MTKDPANPRDGSRLNRVLWLLGLVAGIAVGVAVAYGLATAVPPAAKNTQP